MLATIIYTDHRPWRAPQAQISCIWRPIYELQWDLNSAMPGKYNHGNISGAFCSKNSDGIFIGFFIGTFIGIIIGILIEIFIGILDFLSEFLSEFLSNSWS